MDRQDLGIFRWIMFFCIVICFGIGAIFLAVDYGTTNSDNSGYHSSNCYVKRTYVEEQLCSQSTCFSGFVVVDVLQIEVSDFPMIVFKNEYTSSKETIQKKLDIFFPVNSTIECYYNIDKLDVKPELEQLTGLNIGGFVFFGIGVVLLIIVGIVEIVNCYINKK